MKILAIDTASKVASVAIIENNHVIEQMNDNTEKEHSITLMPMIKEILEKANITLDDIDLIATNIGPGSFTGIRIGIATAKALSDVKKIPTISVNSLEAQAYCAIEGKEKENCKILSIIDAKNDNRYFAVYRYHDGNLSLYKNPEASHLSYIIEYINFAEKLYIIGDFSLERQEAMFQAKIAKEKAEAKEVNGKYEYVEKQKNLAKYIGICAADRYNRGIYNYENELTPMYLRKPQAERNRNNNRDEKLYLSEMMSTDAEEIERNYDKFPNLWKIEQFKEDIKTSKVIVAKQNEEVVGFVSFKNILDEVEIMNIVTKGNKRGQGVASNLLSYIIRKGKANKINLEVNERNITAINLYSRFGFKKVGQRAKYYNGTDDAILMTL